MLQLLQEQVRFERAGYDEHPKRGYDASRRRAVVKLWGLGEGGVSWGCGRRGGGRGDGRLLPVLSKLKCQYYQLQLLVLSC